MHKNAEGMEENTIRFYSMSSATSFESLQPTSTFRVGWVPAALGRSAHASVVALRVWVLDLSCTCTALHWYHIACHLCF